MARPKYFGSRYFGAGYFGTAGTTTVFAYRPATPTFVALETEPYPAEWVILAEIALRERLRGWTLSATPNVWVTAYDPFTHVSASRLDRGEYRGLLGVRDNDVPMAVRADVAGVAAVPGTYFFDAANKLLYVRRTGSTSPNTRGSLLAADFALYVGSRTMNFDECYRGMIDGASLPVIRDERGGITRSVTTYESGDLSLSNGDGFLDEPANNWIWTEGTVQFLVGASWMARADFAPVSLMSIARQPEPGDDRVLLALRSRTDVLSRALPMHTLVDSGLFPLGATDGTLAGMWWGRVLDWPCVPIPSTSDLLAQDPLITRGIGDPWFTVQALRATAGDGTVTTVPANQYTAIDRGRIRLDAMAWPTPGDYTWSADMTRVSGPGSTVPYQQTCGAIARDLLLTCGVPTSLIDTAAFTQADLDCPFPLSVGVKGGVPPVAFVDVGQKLLEIRSSTFCEVYQAETGFWSCRVWTPAVGLIAEMPSLADDINIEAFQPSPGVTHTSVPNARVYYAPRFTSGAYDSISDTSTEDQARLRSTSYEEVTTVLALREHARVQVARLRRIAAADPRVHVITAGAELYRRRVNDRVYVRRPRGGAGVTRELRTVLSIDAIERTLDGQVRITVSDQSGIGVNLKCTAPDSTPDWASASPEERLQYGFTCEDDTECVDPSELTSFRQTCTW